MRPPVLDSLTPFPRLMFTVLLVIASFALTFFAGLLLVNPLFGISMSDVMNSLKDYNDPQTLQVLQYFQVIQSFGLFIFPPLLAGLLFGGSAWSYLKMNNPSKSQIYLLTFFLLLVSVPFINWLVTLNEAMALPGFLREVEAWMRQTEEAATKLTEAFMRMNSPGAFLFNLLLIGILPALGEEMMFRGLLQKLFHEWIGNIHAAIIASALLFSFMHFQFYGFIPRFGLGLCFGYLFYWSGSLWIPVFAHFFNNGAAVVAAYLSGRGIIGGDWESFGSTSNPWIIGLSIVTTGTALYIFYKLRTETRP